MPASDWMRVSSPTQGSNDLFEMVEFIRIIDL